MSSNILAADVEELLEELFDGTSGEVYLIAPSRGTVEATIETLGGVEDVTVRLLADERVLKDVLEDFLVGSLAADLIEAGSLELRTADLSSNTLLASERHVHAVVEAGDRVAGLGIDDPEFVERAYDQYVAAWDGAATYNLRTPAISRVRSTLESELGDDVADDFDAVLGSLETARGNGDGLDEVTVSLLVAARNEELLYDISKWGEDVGIASKATFSRTKTRMEELGLLDTEKVPIDVGRPRLRLVLGEERLRDASPGELANAAQSVLAS